MPESFSLNDLFKKADLNTFKSRFNELRDNQEFSSQFSIFDDDSTEVISENIFIAADRDGSGTIDESEIKLIKDRFQDANQDEISINDLKLLYQEAMFKKFAGLSAEQMYDISMSNGNVVESNYINELDSSMVIYEQLIDNRQITSDARIANYQDEIESIIKSALQRKSKDTNEYERLTKDTKKLQVKYNSNQIELQQKQRELEAVKAEVKRLEKEVSDLKSRPKPDSDDKDYQNKIKDNEIGINARVTELAWAQEKIARITGEISSLKSANASLSAEIKKNNSEITKIQKEILKNDKESSDKVKVLKNNIAQEKSSAEKDIKGYQNEIKVIRNAREYAYNRMISNPAESSPLNFINNGENVPSLKDVKYSKANGEKLAQDIRNHAVGFTGYCSRHVSNALARTGLGDERAASAYMMADKLKDNKNFKQVTISSLEELKSLPAGCVIVYDKNSAWDNGFKTGHYNATHGHIEVTLGDGTACSDGITRNIRYSEQMTVFVPVEE